MSKAGDLKIGILGLGSIASCVAADLAAQGHSLHVSTRSRARSTALMDRFDTVQVMENQDVVSNSDLVFLGMTGATAAAALEPLEFPPGLPVISLMADAETEELVRLIAPAKLEAIAIPFPWIAMTRSPILALPASNIVKELFAGRHDIVALPDEAALRAYLTAQAVLSPALKLLETATDWLSRETGGADEAEMFLRSLVGSALMAPTGSGEMGLSNLLGTLNTPGGYNQRLRVYLEDAGTFSALAQGLDLLDDSHTA